jgi:2-polyprenyl-6-hydroxyphenyl methylase/3-demethylubiquinone-9 3-methyltransferase
LLLAHAGPSLGNGRALDVGCGVGEFTLILKGLGYAVEAVDGNEEQMKTVCSLGFRGETANLENGLPYTDRSFSLVTCLEVIEHVSLAEQLLEHIQRVLRPGGYLLLSTPNFAFLNNRLHYILGAQPLNEGVHLRFFTKRALESLLNRAAFEIVARNSYGVIPLLSTLTTRFLGRDPLLWRVPAAMETLLAYDFIYLSKKRG